MTFTTERSDAIRSLLVETAAAPPARRDSRWIRATGLVVAGAVFGAGGSAAALAASGWRAPDQPDNYVAASLGSAVDAPSGVNPGAPIISLLGQQVSWVVDAPAQLPIADQPVGATHARVTLTCLSAGTFTYSTSPGSNGASLTCTSADAGSRTGTSWDDVVLRNSTSTLYVTPSAGGQANVSVQFVNYVPTKHGINDNGQTYGVESDSAGVPDLILAEGVAPDGSEVSGYVRAADLFGSEEPLTPEEALTREAAGVEPRVVPLWASDGVTQVGTLTIGG